MFVWKHPNLRVRVIHENTLKTTIIINEIHPDVKEVFLTGATSKISQAISPYLCKKQVCVLVCSRNIIFFLHFVWIWLKMGVLLMCFLSSLIIFKFFTQFFSWERFCCIVMYQMLTSTTEWFSSNSEGGSTRM